MKKKLRQAKNKGFTLVELIIVVAVIAILAGVLAPQYLQYVERSRESNDLQVATSIMRAATVAISDPQNDVPGGADVTVTWNTVSDTVGAIVVTGKDGAGNDLADAVITSITSGITTVMTTNVGDAQSAEGNKQNFAVTIDAGTGAITFINADVKAAWGEAGIGVDAN